MSVAYILDVVRLGLQSSLYRLDAVDVRLHFASARAERADQ